MTLFSRNNDLSVSIRTKLDRTTAGVYESRSFTPGLPILDRKH